MTYIQNNFQIKHLHLDQTDTIYLFFIILESYFAVQRLSETKLITEMRTLFKRSDKISMFVAINQGYS